MIPATVAFRKGYDHALDELAGEPDELVVIRARDNFAAQRKAATSLVTAEAKHHRTYGYAHNLLAGASGALSACNHLLATYSDQDLEDSL